jgi:hypothetical protein
MSTAEGDLVTLSTLGMSRVLIQCEYVTPSGWRCEQETIETSERWCAVHCPPDEIDLSAYHSARLRAAKYRLASALPTAADRLVEVVARGDDSTANVIKASTEILDRGGLPKVAAVTMQADITARLERTPGQELTARLDAMAARLSPTIAIIDGSVDPDEDDFDSPPPPDDGRLLTPDGP